MDGRDIRGGDIDNKFLDSPRDCQLFCRDHGEACVMWAFVKDREECYIKSSEHDARHDDSNVVIGPPHCPREYNPNSKRSVNLFSSSK